MKIGLSSLFLDRYLFTFSHSSPETQFYSSSLHIFHIPFICFCSIAAFLLPFPYFPFTLFLLFGVCLCAIATTSVQMLEEAISKQNFVFSPAHTHHLTLKTKNPHDEKNERAKKNVKWKINFFVVWYVWLMSNSPMMCVCVSERALAKMCITVALKTINIYYFRITWFEPNSIIAIYCLVCVHTLFTRAHRVRAQHTFLCCCIVCHRWLYVWMAEHGHPAIA